MDVVDEIGRQVVSALPPDKFLVDVTVSGKKLPRRVQVVIDGDQGVTIDDCAEISRQLSKWLDDSGYFGDDQYLLEVSTPGLEQPLKMRRQFVKNTGRSLKVIGNHGTAEGKLKEVTDEKIVLIRESGKGKKKEVSEIDIPFSEIERAFVLVSFK